MITLDPWDLERVQLGRRWFGETDARVRHGGMVALFLVLDAVG